MLAQLCGSRLAHVERRAELQVFRGDLGRDQCRGVLRRLHHRGVVTQPHQDCGSQSRCSANAREYLVELPGQDDSVPSSENCGSPFRLH